MDELNERQIERLMAHLQRLRRATGAAYDLHRPRWGSPEAITWSAVWGVIGACEAELWWMRERLERRERAERHEIAEIVDRECERRLEELRLRHRRERHIKLDPIRCFTKMQKDELYLRANGHCEACGVDLDSDWQADHRVPHSRGGTTTLDNALALCRSCNSRKRDHVLTVDDWDG